MKANLLSGFQIDDVRPVSTEVYPNGGILIDWSGDIGFGQFSVVWGADGKLHADTEGLACEEDRQYLGEVLRLLADHVVIDA